MAGSLHSLRDRWDAVSEREQRLILLLGVTSLIVVVVWVGMQIDKRLSTLEENNAEMRKALAALHGYRAAGGESQAAPEVPIPDKPVKLQTYLEGIAEEVGIKIPGFNPLTPQANEDYTENSTRIEIRNLSVAELTAFLQKVESKSQVVVIKSLNVRQHFRDREKLDIRMDVATYFQTTGEDSEDDEG